MEFSFFTCPRQAALTDPSLYSPPFFHFQGFELYLCFSPLGTKALAVSAVNKLLKWIRKEEDRLFILSHLTY